MWNVKCENVWHTQNNVTIASNYWICWQFNCKHLLIVNNLDIILFNLKIPEFFSRWLWTRFLWNLFCLKIFVLLFCKQWFMKLFCKSNVGVHKNWSAVVVLEIQKKLTCGSSYCNVGGCKIQIYLKSLRRTSCKGQLFKVTNKRKFPPMIFSLTCNDFTLTPTLMISRKLF